MPGPVICIAPNPSRWTVRSPSLNVPLACTGWRLGAAVVWSGMDSPGWSVIGQSVSRSVGQSVIVRRRSDVAPPALSPPPACPPPLPIRPLHPTYCGGPGSRYSTRSSPAGGVRTNGRRGCRSCASASPADRGSALVPGGLHLGVVVGGEDHRLGHRLLVDRALDFRGTEVEQCPAGHLHR